jgi:hypothetical protein
MLAFPTAAHAWSHQGHILITRLAVLRIVDDPAAPAGLKAFLRASLHDREGKPLTMTDCERLAVLEVVGPEASEYLAGLDGACTLPDRIQETDQGRTLLEPYHAPEAKMHYLDLEYFGAGGEIAYKPDLSSLPRREAIPRDAADPRLASAGYLPHRTAESYGRLVGAFREARDGAQAPTLEAAGYLAHYLEDAYQPHHATMDFRSLSYLAGTVPSVRETLTSLPSGPVARGFRAEPSINPHGDIEFQLFENTIEPRKSFRAAYWSELTRQLREVQATAPAATRPAAYDPFVRSLDILFDSYHVLPTIGKAAQAAYAGGTFDAGAFFSSEWIDGADRRTLVHLIAARNAAAVLEVERAFRAAWSEAHAAPPPSPPEHP